MKKTVGQGRIWVLLDENGKLIEDIDTDQIYHNAFLHITDVSQMGQYALGNLEGWKDFPGKCQPGDILVAGRNFGVGSSRQQAVDCFIALQVSMILASSFGAIYFRNAVNSGLPVLNVQNLDDLIRKNCLKTGDTIQVNFQTGESRNLSRKLDFRVRPMSVVQFDIFQAGNLFQFGKSLVAPL